MEEDSATARPRGPTRSDCGVADRWCHTKGTPMLVLSRKKNESIVINDNIVVTVIDIRGDKVRLGFEAPNDIPIHRKEVYEAIKRSEAAGNECQADG